MQLNYTNSSNKNKLVFETRIKYAMTSVTRARRASTTYWTAQQNVTKRNETQIFNMYRYSYEKYKYFLGNNSCGIKTQKKHFFSRNQ